MSMLHITTQGAGLKIRAGRFVVVKGEDELASLPQAAIDGVVAWGCVQVSSRAVQTILASGIPLVYLTRSGSFRGILEPGYSKNVFVRLAQYEASLDAEFAVGFAREAVRQKLAQELRLISSWERNGWNTTNQADTRAVIRRLMEALPEKQTVDAIRGIEAAAARAYFSAWGQCLPPPFCWQGRNRQPPRDPVNALLSLTYMVALGEVVGICYSRGLDPSVGFLHQLDYGRPSFALDLLEPLRSGYCDRFVMSIMQSESLSPDDFTETPSDGCRLRPESLGRFLSAFAEYAGGMPGKRPPLASVIDRYAIACAAALKAWTVPDWGDVWKS